MDLITLQACITGPLSYLAANGHRYDIPVGPCRVESLSQGYVAVVWGARGQSAVAVAMADIAAARALGHLRLLSRCDSGVAARPAP